MRVHTRSTIIIGAGPAGLAAAVCLAMRGIRSTILERGPEPLCALRRIDPAMTLLSPTPLARLPHLRTAEATPRYMTFSHFIDLLERYWRQHALTIECGLYVDRVERTPTGFSIQAQTADGARTTYVSPRVVNATGVIGNPHIPDGFDPTATSALWLHSLDVRTHHLRNARRLLVIGGGISATQVLEGWLDARERDAHRHERTRAWISLRSPMRAVPHSILGVDVGYLTWLPERIPLMTDLWRRRVGRAPAIGSRVPRAIRRGQISRVGPPTRYSSELVRFADGARANPDLIVFATGFGYRAAHLDGLVERSADGTPILRNCQSTLAAGLYLLGVPFGHNLASAFLRGIARDAAYVAECIARTY